MPTEHGPKPLQAAYEERSTPERKNPFNYIGMPQLLAGAKEKSSISPNGISGTGIGESTSGQVTYYD